VDDGKPKSVALSTAITVGFGASLTLS
jgi:hypothetical protein